MATKAVALSDSYEPHQLEEKWSDYWQKNNSFTTSIIEGKENYCIMLPPPNVTGSLHMGHGFQHTLIDVLIRYHRMCGKNTLWQGGTDHAGIATQMVVERLLEGRGSSRSQLGRKKFIEEVWQWRNESGSTIERQMKRLGLSLDWQRSRFTMDAAMSHAVVTSFVKLYHDDLIYRGERLVNWDSALQTAVSDLEVVSNEEDATLWYFKYPIVDGDHLIVATTRPETMLGDTAVAVHPEDNRYSHFIGKQVMLPISNRLIPVIGDSYVDSSFGSGCVKVTPAHDFNDYDMAQRHQLPMVKLFNLDGTLTEECPADFHQLTIPTARKKVVEVMSNMGLLVESKPYRTRIPRGDRSGIVIEPMLTKQWFVRAPVLATAAVKAVREGDIRFIPKQWENTFFAWMDDLKDWCISRQLWWGHRIPAWFDDDGKIYVATDEQAVRETYQLPEDLPLKQEEDVLDTWFSSGLWTFSTLGWPDNEPYLKAFHPTNVLVTGFDIIFFWIARMMMLSLYLQKEIPFRDIYVHGLVRDVEGRKMSKSLGNILDPLDLIDGIDLDSLIVKRTNNLMQPKMASKIAKNTRKQYPKGIAPLGCDALRFTFCALASTGRDIRFDPSRATGYKDFCNKIWHLSRYVLMNTDDYCMDVEPSNSMITLWVYGRLNDTIENCRRWLNDYRFDRVAKVLHEFIWHEYCDWFVECSKPILTAPDQNVNNKRGVQQALLIVLEQTLRLLHPLMPFITEELWQAVAPKLGMAGDSIAHQPYPEKKQEETTIAEYNKARIEMDWLKEVITAIRRTRSELNIPPSKKLQVIYQGLSKENTERIQKHYELLLVLGRLESIQPNVATISGTLTVLCCDMELQILATGLMDWEHEISRLKKSLDQAHQEITRINKNLANPKFIKKAPEDVVIKQQTRLSELQSSSKVLQDNIAQLKKITPFEGQNE